MATINTAQGSFFPDPPYESWYADCQDRFDVASVTRKGKMLFRAIMFAGHSANNKVAMCERDYSAWVVDNYSQAFRPEFCPSRWERLYDSAMEYILSIDEDWYNRDKWALAGDLARNIVGLGMVKACFALALVGYNLACLDTHSMQQAGYSIAEANYFYNLTNPKKRSDAVDSYRAYHDALYPTDARRTQWAAFREEPTFRANGHRAYFLSQGVNC